MTALYGHQLNALFKIIDMHWHAIEYIGCMSIEHMHILWNSTDMHCSDLKFKCNASKTMDMQGARVDMRLHCNQMPMACRDMQRRAIQVIDMQLQVIDMQLTCIDMHWNSIEIHWLIETRLIRSLNEFGCIVMQANCDWRALKYKW